MLSCCLLQTARPSIQHHLVELMQGTDGCLAAAAVHLVVAALHNKAAGAELVAASGLLPYRQAQQQHLLQALTGGTLPLRKLCLVLS